MAKFRFVLLWFSFLPFWSSFRDMMFSTIETQNPKYMLWKQHKCIILLIIYTKKQCMFIPNFRFWLFLSSLVVHSTHPDPDRRQHSLGVALASACFKITSGNAEIKTKNICLFSRGSFRVVAASCFFDALRGVALLTGLAAGTKEKISDLIFTTWFALGTFFFPDHVLGYQVSTPWNMYNVIYHYII